LKNLYEILNLKKNCSMEEIKQSYRTLARKYHPDINKEDPDAAEKFKEVSAAFEVLSDSDKRKEYDTFGTVSNNPFNSKGKPFTSVFEDMFSQFFREQKNVIKGKDITVEYNATIDQVIKGDEVDIFFNRGSICNECDGLGGSKKECFHCNGTGVKLIRGQAMSVRTTCHACNGLGFSIEDHCHYCSEGYRDPKECNVKFKIWPGVENKMRFIKKGLGEPSADPEGVAGDLYIIVNVKIDYFFERFPKGDVVINWPCSYSELILGAELDIPTLEGRVNLKMPPKTKPGTKFRLKELGFPIFNPKSTIYQRGDQYVNVVLNIPDEIDEGCINLIKKLYKKDNLNLVKIREKFFKKLGE